MSAERLRKAAALMRERALGTGTQDESRGARWVAMPTIDPDNCGWAVAYDLDADGWDTTVAQTPYDYEGHLAQHLASWHPAVALAVADLLETLATLHEFQSSQMNDFGDEPIMHSEIRRAIAVATAYLGSDS